MRHWGLEGDIWLFSSPSSLDSDQGCLWRPSTFNSQASFSPNCLYVWVLFFGSTFSCFFMIFIHFGRLWEACGVLWGVILGVKIEKNGVWGAKWSQVGSRRVLPQCPYPILEVFWVPKFFFGSRVYTSGGPKFSSWHQKTRFFTRAFPVYSQLVPGTTDSSFF